MGIWSYLFPGDEGVLADLFWSSQQASSGISLNKQIWRGTSGDDIISFSQEFFSFNPFQSEVYLNEGNDSVRTRGTPSGTKFFLGDGDDFFTALDGLRFSRIESGNGDDTIWIKESLFDIEGLFSSVLATEAGSDFILIEKDDGLADSRAAIAGGGIFSGDGDDRIVIRGNGLLVQSSGSSLTYADGSTSRDGLINLGEGKDFLGIEKWIAPPPTGSMSAGSSPYLLDSDIDLGGGDDTADLRSLDFSSSTGVLIKGGDGYDVAILPLNISTAPNWLQGFEAFTYTINSGNGTASVITGNGALQEGVTLSAGNISGDPDGNGSITAYQWYLNNAVITGATSATYTTSSTGFGNYRVDLTYIDGQSYAATVASADRVVSKINNGDGTVGAISAQGNAAFSEGVTLVAAAVTGDPDGASTITGYQWLLNNAAITGATAATYTTTATGFGNYRVDISYVDAQAFASTVSSADQAVSKINNGNGTAGAISAQGNAAFSEGVTLVAGSIIGDPDGNGSITAYQWYLNSAVINGATGSTYRTGATGFGNYRVDISYVDGQSFAATVASADQVISKINLLVTTALGYAVKNGASSPLSITNAGAVAGPVAGWSAFAAAATVSGYDLYWKNTNGSYAKWFLNSSAAQISSAVISTATFLQDETNLGVDLDGDGTTGLTFSPSPSTLGTVTLGSTQLGYAIQNGVASPIQISFSGQFASTSTPGAGWSALAAAATGNGYELFWKNSVTGQYVIWLLDATGNLSSGALLSTSELLIAETRLNTDLNGDSSTGLSFSASTLTIGAVTLGTNQLGYAIKNGAASPIQVSFSGQFASSANPGAGWSALAAAATGNGYELFWKNSVTGQYVRWLLDATGNLSSGALLSTSEVLIAETRLNTDLNADGSTGLTFSPGPSTLGSVTLGSTQLGYAIRNGTASPIQISFSGQFASTSNPGAGWNAIAAASTVSGYDLYWKNTNGTYAKWALNSSAALTTGTLLTAANIYNEEVSSRFDLNQDGTIGPLAIQLGTSQNDFLTGGPFKATFGLGGNDTLISGSPYSQGFDILIGGAGDDTYTVAAGRNALIADFGSSLGSTNRLTALGIGLFDLNSVASTIDNQKTLVIENEFTRTLVYFYDWQNPVNRIQTISLSDGNFTFQQIQSTISSLGSSIIDYTWAGWGAYLGDNGLANIGLSQPGAVDSLASYYQSVSALGQV